jgi:SAM-dependent methyltransferase
MASHPVSHDAHDAALARAFDGQAAVFERAYVQSNPRELAQLVAFADFDADSLVLDAGCGPGLVAEALLAAGHRVFGVDLSGAMVERARIRCARFGERARFVRGSVFDESIAAGFDAAISRHVLHHVNSPAAFLARQVGLLRPGGVLVLCDHTTDPDAERAAWHQAVERARDTTHTANHTPGAMVDLCAGAGLTDLRMVEHEFGLDFDEWFDRGTPGATKDEVRALLRSGPGARGFEPELEGDGSVYIACSRALVRGVRGGGPA